MADSTVASMTAASTLDGTELYYGVQGGADRKVTGAQIKTLVSASPTLVTPALGTPASGTMTNVTGLPLTTGVTGTLPVANGGTGTTSPGIVAGTNVTVTGTWPNQTVAAAGGGGGTPGGSTLQIQYNAAGSFAGMAGTSWDNTNQSLAISGATVTASKPLLDLAQTWNNGAVAFTGVKVNITKTAENGSSNVLDLQVGGTSKFLVDPNGKCFFGGASGITADAGGLGLPSGAIINAGGKFYAGSSNIGFGNSYVVGWAAVLSGSLNTGLARNADGFVEVNTGTAGAFAGLIAKTVKTSPLTVATLPSASTVGSGTRAFVSDATSPTWGATVAGSGSTPCPVFSDGTNWKVG